MPPYPGKPVSFADVAFKGRGRTVFLSLLALIVVMFVACAALLSTNIPSQSGTTQNEDIPFEVPAHSTEQVKIVISHTYVLKKIYVLNSFTVEGVDLIIYNLTVYNEAGDSIGRDDSRMSAPETHMFSESQSSDTVTVSDGYEFALQPGKYKLTLASTAPLTYNIQQTSKYSAIGGGLGGLGFIFALVLVLFILVALRKRDALRRSQMAAAIGPLPPPVPAYVPPAVSPPVAPPVQPVAQPSAGGPPPTPPYPNAPMPGSGGPSSLEYVPGGFYAEVVCTACGRVVRNPPVYGVVTCEHCGEQGRLY